MRYPVKYFLRILKLCLLHRGAIIRQAILTWQNDSFAQLVSPLY